MNKERMAKFTLSDGTLVFQAYRPRKNENVLQKLRNLIEEQAGKGIKVKKVETSEIGGEKQ